MSMLAIGILLGFSSSQNIVLANDPNPPPPCNWDGGCDAIIDEVFGDKTAYVYTTEDIP